MGRTIFQPLATRYKSGNGGGGGGPVIYNAITLVFTAVSNRGDNLVTNQCFASRSRSYTLYIYIYIYCLYIYTSRWPFQRLYESRMFMLLAAAPHNLANIGSQFNDRPAARTLYLPASIAPPGKVRFRNWNNFRSRANVHFDGIYTRIYIHIRISRWIKYSSV